MKKTVSKLYDAVIDEATRLHFREGLDWEAAFAKALPKHFHETAEEGWRLPSLFVELVWQNLNKIQDSLPYPDRVPMQRLLLEMQLSTDADGQRVKRALWRLRDVGVVCNPTDRTWSRVKEESESATNQVRSLIQIASAAAD